LLFGPISGIEEDLFEIMECAKRFKGTGPPINLKKKLSSSGGQ